MTTREFHDYHFQVHGRLSYAGPDLSPRMYYQTHFFDSAYNAGSAVQPWYAHHNDVTELYWHDLAHLKTAYSSECARAVVGPDGANFNDGAAAMSMFAREETLHDDGSAPSEGVVAKYYLRSPGQTGGDTESFADQLKDPIAESFAACACSIVVDIRTPDTLGILKYFGPQKALDMALIYTMYLKEGASSIAAFRKAQALFEQEAGSMIDKQTAFPT
ncbi:hypothetical protein PG995_006339 [Apiospora arundinis]